IMNIEHHEEDREDLVYFLNNFLYNSNQQFKVFHPYVYNLMSVSSGGYNTRMAQFFSIVLASNDDNVKQLFSDRVTEDVLSELIINQLKLDEELNFKSSKYINLLPNLSRSYKNDLLFLRN